MWCVCCSLRRQVVLFITALTVVFAVLIWYGYGDNPIDPSEMAQVSTTFCGKPEAPHAGLLKQVLSWRV